VAIEGKRKGREKKKGKFPISLFSRNLGEKKKKREADGKERDSFAAEERK